MKTSSSAFSEMITGFIILGLVWFFSGISPLLTGIAALWIAVTYFYSGMSALRSAGQAPGPAQPRILSAASAPVVNTPTLADKVASINVPKDLKCPSCGAAIRPTDKLCNYCGSSLVPLIDLPQPAYFGNVQVGQSIRVAHPKQGELTLAVRRRLYY